MNWYRQLRMTSKIVLPVAVVLSVILGVLTWQIQSRTSSAIEHIANRELTALGAQYGNYIRDFLGVAIDEAGALAGGLSQALQEGRTISRDTLIAMQTGIHADSATLYGCGTMWEPNAFDGRDAEFRGATGSTAEGRFLPYCAQDAPVTDLGGSITEAYYTVPQKTGKPFLSDPTDYNSNGTIIAMSTASYPVMVDGRFRGTVVADISLAQLDELITGIDVYSTGYAGLLTADGLVVAHKEHGLIGKNLFDVNRFVSPEQARSAFQAGRTYMEEATTKDGDFIRYYQPISLRDTGQNWYVSLVVPLKEVMAEANAIRNVTLGLCGVTLLLMLGVIFILVRSAVAPINYLAKTAEIIAGGNLKQPIEDSRFGGELKQVSSSLKNMIASLIEGIDKAQALSEEAKAESLKAREAMQAAEAAEREARDKTERMLTAADRLDQVAGVVSSASAELSAQIEQSDRGATDSASRLTEAATAMNEMNATVLEVAKNAGSAADVSTSTKERAEEGARIVEHAVDSIQAVQKQSLALKEDMAKLNENAKAITQIMGVISDIADQTNLLALNAAIEAARAGEAGRGFAVVADEVRNLAEKTMSSTSDVGNAINAIQHSVAASMSGVDNAVDLIDQATEFANKSGQALQAIVAMVEETADQVRAIAAASEEQSAASDEINQSLAQVNSVAGQTAQAMNEAARAVAELAEQAQQLGVLIVDMKKG